MTTVYYQIYHQKGNKEILLSKGSIKFVKTNELFTAVENLSQSEHSTGFNHDLLIEWSTALVCEQCSCVLTGNHQSMQSEAVT